MSQRPNNPDLNNDFDSILRRLDALERVKPGDATLVADISTLVNGTSTTNAGTQATVLSIQDRLTLLESKADLQRVAKLPTTNLTDGMVVAWQTDATSPFGNGAYGIDYGVTWMMKYRAGAAYPWECVGGQDMTSWKDSGSTLRNFGSQGSFTALSKLQGDNVEDFPIHYTGEYRCTLDIGYVETNNNIEGNFMAAQSVQIAPSGAYREGYDFRKAALFFSNPSQINFYDTSSVTHGLGATGGPLHRERNAIHLAGDRAGLRYTCTRDYAVYYGLRYAIVPVRVSTS